MGNKIKVPELAGRAISAKKLNRLKQRASRKFARKLSPTEKDLVKLYGDLLWYHKLIGDLYDTEEMPAEIAGAFDVLLTVLGIDLDAWYCPDCHALVFDDGAEPEGQCGCLST